MIDETAIEHDETVQNHADMGGQGSISIRLEKGTSLSQAEKIQESDFSKKISHPKNDTPDFTTDLNPYAYSGFIDIQGQTFGRLTAIKYVGPRLCGEGKTRRSSWLCKCECGASGIVASSIKLRHGLKKSCGCLARSRITERLNTRTEEPVRALNRPLFTRYFHSAKHRNLDFNITIESFDSLATQNCHYCGSEPQRRNVKTKNRPRFMIVNGIDRIDSYKGYVEGNCVPSCKLCNQAKNTMSVAEFTSWISRVYNHFVKSDVSE